MSQTGKFIPGTIGPAGPVSTLTSNAGGAVPPTAGNINVLGGNNVTGTGNPGTSTITFNLTGTTDHAVQVGNSSGSLTSLPLGTAGQILTSNGAGLDPSFQAVGGSISITGDTGGALNSSSFTFTGGATGLKFNGAGTTETLTFAGITANGGTVSLATDATGSTVNIGTGAGAKVVTLGSTNGASSLALKTGTADFSLASATGTIMSALDTGEITYPLQPAFLAYNTTFPQDVTGDGTNYTVAFDTEYFDQNADYNNATFTFTAPVAGKYLFGTTILCLSLIGANTTTFIFVTTSKNIIIGNTGTSFVGNMPVSASVLTNMAAGDTCSIILSVGGGAKITDVYGAAGDPRTNFYGYLVA